MTFGNRRKTPHKLCISALNWLDKIFRQALECIIQKTEFFLKIISHRVYCFLPFASPTNHKILFSTLNSAIAKSVEQYFFLKINSIAFALHVAQTIVISGFNRVRLISKSLIIDDDLKISLLNIYEQRRNPI